MADPLTGQLLSGLVTQADKDFYKTHNRRDVLSMEMPGESISSSGFATDGASEKFPSYDTEKNPPPKKPADFDTPPATLDLKSFFKWHAVWQAAYLKKNGPDQIVFARGADTYHVFLAPENKDRVYILEAMDSLAVMKIPQGNLAQLSQSQEFQKHVSGLGLGLDNGAANSPEKTDALKSIANATQAITSGVKDGAFDPPAGVISMPAADRKLFTDQIDLLRVSVEKNPFISPGEISNKLTAIWDRFKLAASFRVGESLNLGKYNTVGANVDAYWGYFSKDDGATKNAGYDKIIRQQDAILKNAQAAWELAINPTPSVFNAPALIYKFQLHANQAQEAEIAVATEEIKQLNALIQDYNLMQKMVGDTLKSFQTTDDDKTKRPLLNVDTSANDAWKNGIQVTTVKSDRIVMMFDKTGNGQKTPHPLEALFSVERPQHDLVKIEGDPPTKIVYGESSKDQWTRFGDQLSSAVTQLNQQSQILTDRINSFTKAKDRHFDLGNNTLSKMSDMIQTIGRNIA